MKCSLLTMSALAASCVCADVVYVRTPEQGGNDGTGERGNPDRPFATVATALSKAQDNDTVEIGAGEYVLSGALTTSVGPLTIRGTGANARDVKLDGNGGRGFVFTGGKKYTVSGLWMTNCVHSGTAEADRGSAVLMSNGGGTLIVTNCVFTGCKNTQAYGGAIYSAINFYCYDSHFEDNEAYLGGGAFCGNCPAWLPPPIVGCTFVNNRATKDDFLGYGGAMYLIASDKFARLDRCTFINNSATREGGAINGGILTMTNCTFIGNTAGYRGGAYCNNAASPNSVQDIVKCVFKDNTSSHNGGAVYIEKARAPYKKVNVVDSWFENNTCDGYWGATDGGGALCIYNGTEVYAGLTRCTFVGNKALKHPGGAIWGEFSEIVDCVFSNNTAKSSGGVWKYKPNAAGKQAPDALVVRNSLFADNDVSTGSTVGNGGAVALEASVRDLSFENCTFAQNTADGAGDALHAADGAAFTAANCLFSSGTGEEISAASADLFSHCFATTGGLLTDGVNGNVVRDAPGFVDPEGGDFRLTGGSPCVDAATELAWMKGATDLAGGKRIAGKGPDIGAYEFNRYGLLLLLK